MPCFHAIYCSSVFFTIFSERARFAFQVHCQSGQARQTVLILVDVLLADRFCVEFRRHSDFKNGSSPCSLREMVNRHYGSSRWILKYFFFNFLSHESVLASLPVTLRSFPRGPQTPIQVSIHNPTSPFETYCERPVCPHCATQLTHSISFNLSGCSGLLASFYRRGE